MAKKKKTWIPVFVVQSSASTRIGFASDSSLSANTTSAWHDFFFGCQFDPKQNLKVHTNKGK